jgi:ABC-type phosphate/phosphonate transport system substrate-binding protein
MRLLVALILALGIAAVSSSASERQILIVGVQDNLVLKQHQHRATSTLNELTTLVGRRVRVATDLQIIRGGTRQALQKNLEDLRKGHLHLVAMTGLEYGWLRQLAGGDVEALVVANTNMNVVQYERVFVRANEDMNLARLRGRTLAIFDAPNPSMRVYLNQLRRRWGSTFLNKQSQTLPSAAHALKAVLAGKADAAIVDLYTMQGYEKVFPGQMKRLESVGQSQSFPLAPVVGIPRMINSMRDRLWSDLQAELTQIHAQHAAKAFLDVWRVSRFNLPAENFDKEANQAAVDFDFGELP